MKTLNDRPGLGILFICLGVVAISVNDMLIKLLSDGYPLHEIVAARSAGGLLITLTLVQLEGGWASLRTATPGLHLLRGLMVVLANMTYYAAVAVIPLGQATALFFVAPLFITLLSVPLLGEKVGPLRLGAVLVGLLGVVVMQQPWKEDLTVSRLVLALPVISALFYAAMQVLTRKLGISTRASVLAVYLQVVFLAVSFGFWLAAGDGRYADRFDSESMRFLLRPWVMPDRQDALVLLGLGVLSGFVGYALSAAYRMAQAAVIAPFEYIGLPMAILWGWLIFGDWPGLSVWLGCALIVGAGLFVFLRERQRDQPAPGRRRLWGRR
ncbi:DMT family transporter [Salipiger sp. 1_MG-2023]|uniref:DMT family transporter n=1 Tax=Salipiger sp. 1_MG-2023 TaxID=3062665 RepID=UPI0026E3DC1D|nr:DMT family transporter [Salipiger sp. 1_MG-2023]MDO6584514.1 DMT family transporter [Salipiger sp. 1_MG-2023]